VITEVTVTLQPVADEVTVTLQPVTPTFDISVTGLDASVGLLADPRLIAELAAVRDAVRNDPALIETLAARHLGFDDLAGELSAHTG
jgi:hypothetical protein